MVIIIHWQIFKRPALTLKIDEDYFNNNLAENADNYDLENGQYERTIPEADLNFSFGTTDDGNNTYMI